MKDPLAEAKKEIESLRAKVKELEEERKEDKKALIQMMEGWKKEEAKLKTAREALEEIYKYECGDGVKIFDNESGITAKKALEKIGGE